MREKALEFIEEQDVFEEEDMKEYLGTCMALICNKIKMICTMAGEKSGKKRLLKDITDSTYYKSLDKKKKVCKLDIADKIILQIFQKERYGILLLLGDIYNLVKK